MERLFVDDSLIDEWVLTLKLPLPAKTILLDPKKMLIGFNEPPTEYLLQMEPMKLTSSRIYERKKTRYLIKWIEIYCPFVKDSVQFNIFNGYLYIIKNGITNIIDQINTPGLKILQWQYGIPIDYESLTSVDEINTETYWKEFKKILINHTLIAINVREEYVLYMLKQILYLMFIDEELSTMISKIKVKLNMLSDQPPIIICPRYGLWNAQNVIIKLQYYLERIDSIVANDANNIYDDFIKVTNLIFVANAKIKLIK